MNVYTLLDSLPDFDLQTISFDTLPYELNNLTLLGSGAVGSVYSDPRQPNLVLKYQHPPGKGIVRSKCIDDYYESLHPFTFYSSPFPLNRNIVTLPNIISEAYIGGILSILNEGKYSVNFPITKELGYLPREGSSFIVMERLENNLSDVINSFDDFVYMLFQIVHALMVSQEISLFTHYDFHIGNVLYSNLTNVRSISFPLPDGDEIILKNRGYLIKISDFGLSVGKYRDTIIGPVTSNCVQRTFGVFNPYYDLITFWGSLLVDVPSLRNNGIVQLFRRFPSRLVITLLRMFFPIPSRLTNHIEILEWIRDEYYAVIRDKVWWRPKDINWVKNTKFYNCHQILYKLRDFLSEWNLTSGRIISPNLALKPLPRYRLEQITPKLSYYSAHPNKFLREIEQGIKINSYVFSDKSAIKPYNLVLPDSELEQCGKRLVTKTHYITEVVINPQLVKRRGYSFNLSCCRSSLIDFMILNSLNGVAINGGFYDINKSYLPTSIFKNERLNTETTDIPKVYLKYFGMYYIDPSGILRIDDISIDKARNKQFEICGPVLVRNGRSVITDKMLNQVINGKLMFQCATPIEKDESKYLSDNINDEKTCVNIPSMYEIPNCDKITGGELSHSSNPNPRSMLVSRRNSMGEYQIVFVVVEGRDDRGSGMDLKELSEFAIKRYNPEMALNLDGGGSSNIITKIENDPTYYVVNETKETKYPLGSIISLTRPNIS